MALRTPNVVPYNGLTSTYLDGGGSFTFPGGAGGLDPSTTLRIGDGSNFTPPSNLNVPGFGPPWGIFATNNNSRSTIVLASGNAGAADGKTAQIVFMQSNGSLQNPNSNVAGGNGAINGVSWVGGSVADWRTFTVFEFGNRGADPQAESDVKGKFQLGCVNGGISNRPGLVVLNDTVLLTNDLPLRLYKLGMQNTYNGEAFDFERAEAAWNGNTFEFGTRAEGSGVFRDMLLKGNVVSTRAMSLGSSLVVNGGATLTALTAGSYTPSLTNVANLTASTAYKCQWSRVGNVVNVSGKVDVDPTLTATSTQLGISLPVASNIGAAEDCAGTAFAPGIAGQGAAILGDATNNRAQMEWISTDVTNQAMYFTFGYEVLP